MNVLVISNCATKAYIQGMRLLFPESDVRGIRDKGAAEFVEKGKIEFLKFAETVDVYVGCPIPFLTHNFPALSKLPLENPKTVFVNIPYFVFRGLQPDIFYLRTDVKSILPPDTMYSRLVVTAYLVGLTVHEAMATFNESVYRHIGYFHAFDDEANRVYKTFYKYGVDIQDYFQDWIRAGQFVYTLNHAKIFVYFDILLAALSNHFERLGTKRELQSQMRDYLADAPIWPVYPELAARRGMSGSLIWHTRKGPDYEQLSLDTFVSRSYENLALAKSLSPSLVPGFEAAKEALEASF